MFLLSYSSPPIKHVKLMLQLCILIRVCSRLQLQAVVLAVTVPAGQWSNLVIDRAITRCLNVI